jgi:decaprenylphospho-beta-D-ribofuranose 2-oxidase
MWAEIQLAGWGRHLRAASHVARPERMAEAVRDFSGAEPSCLAYGNGRSYGDCALNSKGSSLMTTRLDRILSFDSDSGVISVEPGVTFARLFKLFLPRGFLVPVTPGTGFATIGGALANDVHGKNHDKNGSFGQHVISFTLALPSGERREITRDDAPALFDATMGGIGLTGFITGITFRMMRVAGSDVSVRSRRAYNLVEFIGMLREARGATYSVGWIDGTARGIAMGRGILETAEPAGTSSAAIAAKKYSMPFDLPGFVLNPLSIGLFNALYFDDVPRAGRERLQHYGKFLYPLDAIAGWNRIYGKEGFHQFQCVIPDEAAEPALRKLLTKISEVRRASFLAVLKTLGPGSGGYLSFPLHGFTLALDFPNFPGIAELHHQLVAIAKDYGGRVYLAKDSLLTPAEFDGMYPDLPKFMDVLAEIDPRCHMASDMSRRLRISRP